MQLFVNVVVLYLLQVTCILFLTDFQKRRRFSIRPYREETYYPESYYVPRGLENGVKTALDKLQHAPKWVSEWPDSSVKLGQVSGVALNAAGDLLVFHRGYNKWDFSTFTARNIYSKIGEPPIPQHTVLVFNDTGDLVDMWGENLFHMPHGITVDTAGNVWVTDVALHQVFKFTPNDRQKPALTLGEKFVPGDDDFHFCKPSAVAVLPTGEFFVADGYCNTRIVKFAPDGSKILQWGRQSGKTPFSFNVPHALTLALDRGLVCVADRERGRVACFNTDNGNYVTGFKHWLIGPRLFSVAYSPVKGGRLYIVNGPTGTGEIPVRGYVIDFNSTRLIATFAPTGDFSNPHDVVASPDGTKVYVAELNPYRVYKFVDDTLKNDSHVVKKVVKPTTTVEISSSPPSSPWGGIWAGVAGAAAAGGFALMAVALLRARKTGRKSLTRRRWEYGHGEFKLRRLLERRRFTRVHSEDSDEEPAPMLPPQPPATA